MKKIFVLAAAIGLAALAANAQPYAAAPDRGASFAARGDSPARPSENLLFAQAPAPQDAPADNAKKAAKAKKSDSKTKAAAKSKKSNAKKAATKKKAKKKAAAKKTAPPQPS